MIQRVVTKAPKSLPLCLLRNCSQASPGSRACVNMPRRGGGVAAYGEQFKIN